MNVRSVFKSSRFFNISDCISGFFVKVTNQLTIACTNYLTNHNTLTIWEQENKTINIKIYTCKQLLISYKTHYENALKAMEESPNETPWECSRVLIFGNMDTFRLRLKKIKDVMSIALTYSVLDRINISGTEKISNDIKQAFKKISSKPYNPLAYRSPSFDNDYDIFIKEVEAAEAELQQSLKAKIHQLSNTHSMLLLLKRFERLELDCLCLDRRYLDVAMFLEKEIEQLKDMLVLLHYYYYYYYYY